jgi:hypothetical protein
VGWSSLEAYGKRMNWPVKQVSRSTPKNHGKSGGGRAVMRGILILQLRCVFLELSSVVEDEEMVPLPTAIKPVVVSELGMNSGGEACLIWRTIVMVMRSPTRCPKIIRDTPLHVMKKPTVGGEEATDKDNKSIKSMKSVELKNICAGGHRWEEGNKPSYAVNTGIFTGRKCALVVGFNLLMGWVFGGGKYLEDWEWTNEGQSLHEM